MPMDSVYEDISRILENRRIRSEILCRMKNEQIRSAHPEIASMERKISELEKERMLLALNGGKDASLEKTIREKEAELEKLLQSFQIRPEDMAAEPFCKLCGDTGYVKTTEKDGTESEVLCSCIRSLLAPVMLSRSGVEEYPSYSFEKGSKDFYKDSPKMAALYDKLRELSEKEKIPNLVFYGISGKGKTFLSVSVVRQYASAGRSALILRLPDFQEICLEHRKVLQSFYIDPKKERDIEDRFAYVNEADLLVLDDLGVEARTANAESDLLSLLDRRLLSGKKTIITTNYALEALRERYGGRFFDRIDRNFKTVLFAEEGKKT